MDRFIKAWTDFAKHWTTFAEKWPLLQKSGPLCKVVVGLGDLNARDNMLTYSFIYSGSQIYMLTLISRDMSVIHFGSKSESLTAA